MQILHHPCVLPLPVVVNLLKLSRQIWTKFVVMGFTWSLRIACESCARFVSLLHIEPEYIPDIYALRKFSLETVQSTQLYFEFNTPKMQDAYRPSEAKLFGAWLHLLCF